MTAKNVTLQEFEVKRSGFFLETGAGGHGILLEKLLKGLGSVTKWRPLTTVNSFGMSLGLGHSQLTHSCSLVYLLQFAIVGLVIYSCDLGYCCEIELR